MIRPAEESDLDYVYATWAHGVVSGKRLGSMRTRYLLAQVNDAMEQARVIVDVRPGKRPEGDIVGWLCYTPLRSTGVVHWVYVRKTHRGNGIARGLLDAAGVDTSRAIPYTSEAKAAADISEKPKHFVPMKDILL